ncbi:mannose-6-phosphate isomerase, class I [Propionimicrobium sp. PCR01-08-3]|uniref:mannose-6-phosphate isomerase, class I n=1 Tax=Propionimicrobium sp. PCR01-08-3 TaxID=3052086 RepID=UPI00255C5139|nr:mannose-6-phosphate isomerase, class I [Propionimicrobium sp. PCR01-08-3]WIY82863.1 mannose-6-phosphate isomerase, class I [Propionimicrobium sp. PCR01-08-3]
MHPLTGSIKRYDWGSHDAIPAILGIEDDGRPLAEYWLGAHPSGPARIDDGVPLDDAISQNPAMAGDSTRLEFEGRLPYLMKLLSAGRPLSLQAHPNRIDAQAGFARENAEEIPLDAPERTFKDPWDKPELLIALTEFDALAGFRAPEASAELFAGLGICNDSQKVFTPLLSRGGRAGLAEVFMNCLVTDDERTAAVTDVVAAAINHVDDEGELGDFARTAVTLDEHFPGDPSLLAALLLTRHHLKPGEALYLQPGRLHSYLHGTGVEVMGNSDNVLRGGLTSKHIDPSALAQVVNFTTIPIVPMLAEQELPGLWRYPTDERSFACWRLELIPGRMIELPGELSGRILLATRGEIGVSQGQDDLVLVQGQAAFLEAGRQVQISGDGQGFLTATGMDA